MKDKEGEFRIAVSANADLGGTEKAATIYAVELARRGYRVDYLAQRKPSFPAKFAARHVTRSATLFNGQTHW